MSNLLIVILSLVKVSLDLFDDRSLYIYLEVSKLTHFGSKWSLCTKIRKHKSLLNLHFDGPVIVQVCENKMHPV